MGLVGHAIAYVLKESFWTDCKSSKDGSRVTYWRLFQTRDDEGLEKEGRKKWLESGYTSKIDKWIDCRKGEKSGAQG